MNLAKNLDFEEENVGTSTTVLKSKISKNNKYITSMEEYLSIPKERRDKAIAEMKYFFENAETLLPQAIKEACRAQLERGTPIAYGDDEGRVLKRYPDGRIFLVDVDLKTYEKTETFFRMATSEDDIGIYD